MFAMSRRIWVVARTSLTVSVVCVCRPPLTMSFNVPMFSASPLRVLYLKVHERGGYPVEKWVRKVCKAGGYHCRIK
jgi:hypothetical protein